MLDAIGIAAALVVAAGGGVATALLIRGRLNAPVLRSLGGTIMVLGVATGAAMFPITIDGMPVIGAGGYLGAMSSTWLLEHFRPIGASILTLMVIAVGLLLTTDYALLYAGRAMVAKSAKASKSGMHRAARAVPLPIRRKHTPFTDLETPIRSKVKMLTSVATARQGPRIRLRQPKRSTSAESGGSEIESINAASTDPYDVASEQGDPADDDESDEYEDIYEEEEDYDEVDEEESYVRELELDDETVSLRGDAEHSLPAPKIKVPSKNKVDTRQQLYDNVKEAAPTGIEDYRLPAIQLLEASDDISYDEQLSEVRRKARILEATFKNFGFNIRVVEIETGPVIAQYEIELEAGLRLSKITGLADDLAIALRVPSVRIVAPIPGKNTVGIEVPNETRQVVRLRDVMEESDTRIHKMNIPVFLGKDVSGNSDGR